MRDIDGKVIQKGDVVVCLKPVGERLKMHGLYTVEDVMSFENRLVLVPDSSGREGNYSSTRFRIVDLSNIFQG